MMPDQASTADMLVVKTLVTPTQDGVRLAIAPAVSPSDRARPGLGPTGRARAPRERCPPRRELQPTRRGLLQFRPRSRSSGFPLTGILQPMSRNHEISL